MHETDPQFCTAAEQFRLIAQSCATAQAARDSQPHRVLKHMIRRLADEPEIRFFMDGTKNLGHQAATITLVRRLIELTGFTGRLTVLYADYGKEHLGITAHKIAVLVPGIDSARIDYSTIAYGACRQIRFMNYARRRELDRRVLFGFTGGADDMSINYAAELNVDWFLRIQPFLWDDDSSRKSDPYYESSRIEHITGKYFYFCDAFPNFRELPIKLPTPGKMSVSTPQTRDDASPAVKHSVPLIPACNAQYILELAQNRDDVLLWPIYGLQHFKDSVAHIVLRCVLAAFGLLKRLGGKIVLLSLCPQDEIPRCNQLAAPLARDLPGGNSGFAFFRAALNATLSQAGADDDASSIEREIARIIVGVRSLIPRASSLCLVSGYDGGSGRFVDMSDSVRDALRTGAGPSVVFASVGPVASDLFHHIMAESPLPPIIEGQVTSNLMTNLGRPFVQILRSEHVIKNGYVQSVPGRSFCAIAARLNRAAQSLALRLSGPIDNKENQTGQLERQIEDLVDVIADCIDETSEVHDYFSAVSDYCSRDPHDKFALALTAMGLVVSQS